MVASCHYVKEPTCKYAKNHEVEHTSVIQISWKYSEEDMEYEYIIV